MYTDLSSMVTTPTRFLDPALLARIGSLELLARTVVEGFMSGLHRSPFTGFSTELTEYRQYNPGDDLRYLDWRLLGRTDRYFIKKYRADSLHQLAEILTRRGIVIIISDLYDQPERLQESFQHLRFRGHDLVAFQVLDQNELDFDFTDAILLLEDSETEEQIPVLTQVVMGGYRERMRQ